MSDTKNLNLDFIKEFIRDVPDFPKPGIVFKDIGPLLEHRFAQTIDAMSQQVDWSSVDAVMGIESRGFIFASALAQKHRKGFIPVRKRGKLPPPVVQESYSLEYGQDCLELSQKASPGAASASKPKILLVDDVLATGGTVKAAVNLCDKAQLDVLGVLFLINLKALNEIPSTFAQKGIKFYSLVDF